MSANQKLKSRVGFTLAETLVTVLILLMVSSVVAAGIPAAKNAYEKVVRSANAEVLLSTSVSELRKNLVTAQNVTADENGVLTFYSGDGEINKRIYPDPENNGVLKVQEYIGFEEGGTTATPRQLVTDAASTRDLYVTYKSASCDGQLVTIKGLSVYRKSQANTDEAPLTSIDTLYIRVIGNPETDS